MSKLLDAMRKEVEALDGIIGNMPFDPAKKQPDGYMPVDIAIALSARRDTLKFDIEEREAMNKAFATFQSMDHDKYLRQMDELAYHLKELNRNLKSK